MSRSNVYPPTSCCVLDVHFVLKSNFLCKFCLMGNDFALYFVRGISLFFFLGFCTISFILCKKKQTNKLITDAIYFLFDQEAI